MKISRNWARCRSLSFLVGTKEYDTSFPVHGITSFFFSSASSLLIFFSSYFLSFFSFLSFSFCFSFSFPSFSCTFISLGIRVLTFVIRSPLRKFCCPLLRGKGWGFSSWAKVQSILRLCLNMVFSLCVPDFDIWGETDLCVGCRFQVKLSYNFHEARVTMMIWK